jgi:hypothetical protein
MLRSEINWTNSSVRQLSAGADPIERIVTLARKVILGSSDSGIKGPPFDPFEIAKYMGIQILPSNDVPDARTVPLSGNKFLIEYNPNQPKGRIRFSLAHELSHTLFPDCANYIRNRERPKGFASDRWQLEMLCNIGASEFLMPIGSFPDLAKEEISIGNLMNLRVKYDVSSEALFLRVVRLTRVPCFAFCATRIDPDDPASRYGIDYVVCSKSWGLELPRNLVLPSESFVRNCTAVGYKLIADEVWDRRLGQFHVECVGIPPYPSHRYPRVLGIVTKSEVKKRDVNSITYKFGDATEPSTKGNFIIAHVVNDRAQRWGGRGFAKYLKSKWPATEKAFLKWRQQNPGEFKLGCIHKFNLDDRAQVISMIAQKGYGPSDSPRIRYNALKACLKEVGREALSNSASVHMPRIGSGQAGGSWNIISELIEDELCSQGIQVSVYDLPPNGSIPDF